MRNTFLRIALSALAVTIAASVANAQVHLIARGTLTSSRAGSYKDLSGLNYTLENGAAANLLGGLGSGMTYVSGKTFLAVPDRGPNAIPFNSLVDDTVSYITRFHTLSLDLKKQNNGDLPYTVTTKLESTTLLHSLLPLVYGTGEDYGIGSGVPPLNNWFAHYFTGRSDNYDPNRNSGNPFDARFDPESIRVSNDGLTVFISDEYGPYVYQFLRATGDRIRSFTVPGNLYVATPEPTTTLEQGLNSSGRVPNKGMEGLAITPDGRTLVGAMQAPLIQDAAEGGDAANLLRFVSIDILSGKTHEYAYLLTTGSGVSDLVALNNHEFLVDERDGKGLGDGSKAKVKQIFKIDLAKAVDITKMDGTEAAKHAVSKTLFLDLVQALTAPNYTMTPDQIPAKIEGITFGPDVNDKGKKLHTLWISNDNDFVQNYGGVENSNPNQFFVFAFTDKDLGGSVYQPQQVKEHGRF